MSSEVNEALRRSARLRARADQQHGETPPARLPVRLWEGLVDSLVLLTVLALAADAWLAFQTL